MENIQLIDRDNSDNVIVQKNFDIAVGEQQTQKPTTTPEKPVDTEKPTTNEKLPTTYPKTGMTQYIFIVAAILSLVAVYILLTNHKKSKH